MRKTSEDCLTRLSVLVVRIKRLNEFDTVVKLVELGNDKPRRIMDTVKFIRWPTLRAFKFTVGVCMLHNSKTAGLIYSAVNFLGGQYSILGGYPRDLYFSKTPNDLDIFVYQMPLSKTLQLVNALSGLCQNVKFNVFDDGYTTSDFAYGTLNIGDIDVVICKPDVILEQQILDGFDYNLNQFKFDCNKIVSQPSIFVGKDMYVLTPIDDRTASLPDRKDKMIHYAESVNWCTKEAKICLGKTTQQQTKNPLET